MTLHIRGFDNFTNRPTDDRLDANEPIDVDALKQKMESKYGDMCWTMTEVLKRETA